jgi:Flp pilus assembly protein TadG
MLMVPVLGMAAFTVDLGWIAVTKAQLKNATDAAAIAAVGQLIDGHVLYNLPQQTRKDCILSSAKSTAKAYARKFAGYNRAGGTALEKVNDTDIEFGTTNAANQFQALSATGGFPNTVRVTVRRDGNANGELPLFFARMLGINSTSLQATAAATIFTGSAIQTFRSDTQAQGLLLPVALDIDVWNNYLATGQSGDGETYCGPNGAPQLKIYPTPKNAPGNFGLLCIGPPSSSVNPFRDWIDYGPTASDLQYLVEHNMLPVSPTARKMWEGGPGMKSTLRSNFYGIIGKPRLLPLFEPISRDPYQAATGEGSHTYYQIQGFGGVTITEASGSGSNMLIAIQPCATLDPTAVYQPASITPAAPGGSTPLITTAVAPKLTQ